MITNDTSSRNSYNDSSRNFFRDSFRLYSQASSWIPSEILKRIFSDIYFLKYFFRVLQIILLKGYTQRFHLKISPIFRTSSQTFPEILPELFLKSVWGFLKQILMMLFRTVPKILSVVALGILTSSIFNFKVTSSSHFKIKLSMEESRKPWRNSYGKCWKHSLENQVGMSRYPWKNKSWTKKVNSEIV